MSCLSRSPTTALVGLCVPRCSYTRTICHADPDPKTMVAVVRKDVDVLALVHLSTHFCAVAQLKAPNQGSIYALCVYLRPLGDIVEELAHLAHVLWELRRAGRHCNVVISGDLKAHSPQWFSRWVGMRP